MLIRYAYKNHPQNLLCYLALPDEFYLTIFVITLQEHFVYGSKHYVMTDQVRFLGKCPPTPPLSQY